MLSTVTWKSLTLADLGRFDFQILVSLLHAFHARAFLVLMFCKLLCVQDPRYLKSLTTSRIVPVEVLMDTSSWWLNTMHFVFLAFICRPTRKAASSTLSSNSWAWQAVSKTSAMSSAKSRSVTIRGPILRLRLGFTVNKSCSSLPFIADCWSCLWQDITNSPKKTNALINFWTQNCQSGNSMREMDQTKHQGT